MYQRHLHFDTSSGDSMFLFGARQTGKSTLLRMAFPHAVYIDLLDNRLRKRLSQTPELLYDTYKSQPAGTLIIIDEIPEVPQLLNEVHRLISEFGLTFILCGSSARKLKRKGYNTLGGRALPCYLYPLVSAEIPDFDLQKALQNGMIPPHYAATNAERRLSAYIDVYLREEIKAEALVRNITGFQRFLEIAALTNGEMVNYNNIASDCGVSANTIKEYFSILEDTLVGYMIPAFAKTQKRKIMRSPKFWYFDVGVVNYLLHRLNLTKGTPEYGHAFEHFVIQEVIAYLGYAHSAKRLSYWRTYSGQEVDAVIGNAEVAIEIKSTDIIQSHHLKGLRAFSDEFPDCKLLIVSQDCFNRTIGNIESLYILDFLHHMWKGNLF